MFPLSTRRLNYLGIPTLSLDPICRSICTTFKFVPRVTLPCSLRARAKLFSLLPPRYLALASPLLPATIYDVMRRVRSRAVLPRESFLPPPLPLRGLFLPFSSFVRNVFIPVPLVPLLPRTLCPTFRPITPRYPLTYTIYSVLLFLPSTSRTSDSRTKTN